MKNDIEKQKFYYPTKFLLCFLTGVCMLAFSAYSVEGMAAGKLAVVEALQQVSRVTGVVTDSEGEPVIGASVIEGKSTNGTITDIDGNFSLNVSANSTLTISFVGYKTQTVSVNGKTALKVTLQEDTDDS